MKDFLVVANLKMNLLAKDLNGYLKGIENIDQRLVVCPTSIYIPYFLKHHYSVGIQNVFYEEMGSYTGEVSPKQASSLGIKYAIIGHSERRNYLNESDHDLNKKISACLKNGMKVILCIGETLEEKNMMKTSTVLKRQLMSDLRGVEDFKNIYIAYEPIWAIGSGKIPSNQDIQDTVSYIKDVVRQQYKYDDVNVLYGGSVDETNIDWISSISNIAGVLVGGASLNPEKLIHIVKNVSKEVN